jgi:predicted MFS family arabinose efflux permease
MTREQTSGRSFEWWMISFFGFGAGFQAFVSLLIPPFVTQATGNAADAGIVMAIISLAAVLGPVLGGFADKYKAHRLVLNLGMFGMAFAFALYALSAGDSLVAALDAIVMGTSIAAINAVGPVFILGAGLSQELQAKRMTTLNLLAPVGQVVGGALLGAAASAGWSFAQRFWLAAGFMLVAALIVFVTSRAPAERIQVGGPADEATAEKKASGLRQVMASTFGVYLLILILSSVGNNGINAQIANILPNVYGFSEAQASGLISLAGVLNIIGFIIAGAWMARRGPVSDFTGGNIIRLLGAVSMAVLGLVASAPLLLAAAAMQLLYVSGSFVRLAQPVVAVRFATIPAGAASGWVIGAAAIGSFVGSLLGGWLADAVGFNAINWMAAISVGAAVLLIFIVLLPAERRKREGESKAAASEQA